MKIIGITGRKGHGKDTAALALPDYVNVKFAAPLKGMLRSFMVYAHMDSELRWRCLEGDLKEQGLALFGGYSTRHAMQTLGTEWGRDLISPDIWTNAFRARASRFDKVVCADVRFPNEVAVIKSMGGLIIRVHDPRKFSDADQHSSEAAIDSLPVDTVIVNDGTIDDLHAAMRGVVS